MKKRLKTKPADQWTDPVAPPSGARFVPVDAGNGVGWGVLRRELADQRNDLRAFVFDKAHPIKAQRQGDFLAPWSPTATMDVLLPDDAPAELMDARRLAERYEAEAFPGIKDLAICVSLKISRPDHVLTDWVRIRAFARDAFCVRRHVAAIAVLHVPARSGVRRDAHVHLIAPARELRAEFGAFLRPFASDAGAPILAAEWAAWR